MRFGTFLIGGIVGAAAVMYLSGNKPKLMTAFSGKGDSLENMMTKAVDNMGTQSSHKSSQTNNSFSSVSKSSNSGGMTKVADIVNADPKLKAQVDEILSQNHDSKSASSTASKLQ